MGIKGKVFSQPFLNQESPRTGPGNYCTAQGFCGPETQEWQPGRTVMSYCANGAVSPVLCVFKWNCNPTQFSFGQMLALQKTMRKPTNNPFNMMHIFVYLLALL